MQLQSGWFLAALVLLLATISFVAGMAVRRGALNAVMGDVDDVAQPKSAPAPAGGKSGVESVRQRGRCGCCEWSGNAVANRDRGFGKSPLDDSGGKWREPRRCERRAADAGERTQPTRPTIRWRPLLRKCQIKIPRQAQHPTGHTAAKPGAPLLLSLPETPISASGSIAIRATGMVPIPSGEAQSAQHARNLQIGELTNLVEPVYPPEARQARVEGTVKLHVVVGANGEIQSFRTISGPESLAQAAMIAVREWRYRPTLLNGKAVETQEDVTFVFRLPN